jgi:hypothetical protein
MVSAKKPISGKEATMTITVNPLDDPLAVQKRTLLVPGMPGETIYVRFNSIFKSAAYCHEVGVFPVDDEQGRMNSYPIRMV